MTCPPELTQLGETITKRESTIANLQAMGDKMQSCGHFSDREVEAVADTCIEMLADVKRMKADLARSLAIWEGEIVHLEQRLAGRASVIEMFEATLAACPGVMDLVAVEQVALQKKLDDAKGQLCDDIPGASSPAAECSGVDNKSDDGDPLAD